MIARIVGLVVMVLPFALFAYDLRRTIRNERRRAPKGDRA